MNRLRGDRALTPEVLELPTGDGMLAFVSVGESRYAVWNCDGELIHLVERQFGGRIAEVDASPYQGRYAYERVAARPPERTAR